MWEKDDFKWFGMYTSMAVLWYASVASLSFTMFAFYPMPSYYVLTTTLVCYILYAPLFVAERWKRDKILMVMDIALWCWLLYITVGTMKAIHNYNATGVLPDFITNTPWRTRWYSYLIYFGAACCPAIYIWAWRGRVRDRREREKFLRQQEQRRREMEERLAALSFHQQKFYQ